MTLQKRSDYASEHFVKLCQQNVKAVNYYYDGKVIVNGSIVIDLVRVVTYDIYRDFVNNFTDVVTLEVVLDATKYYRDIVPNLNNLEIILRKRQMAENSILFVRGGDVETNRYKAFLYDAPKIGLSSGQNIHEVVDPQLKIVTATFQCIRKDALEIMLTEWQGLLEMTNPAEALRMVLDSVGGDNHGFEGVHMTDWDVKSVRQIIVPRGTRVINLGRYLQQSYGIYNHGIGTYIFDNHYGKFWWVYPLFNNRRYEKEYYKCTIRVTTPRQDPLGQPRTYYVDKGHLNFYTVDEAKLEQTSPADTLNNGTGVRVLNSSETTTGTTVEVNPNQHIIDGSTSMTSFNTVERADGYKNYISVYENVNNMARLISSVAANGGQYLNIIWRFGHEDLLYPGMPMKVIYMQGNQEKVVYGTLHSYNAVSVRQGNGMQEAPFNCTIGLRIFVTEKPNIPI